MEEKAAKKKKDSNIVAEIMATGPVTQLGLGFSIKDTLFLQHLRPPMLLYDYESSPSLRTSMGLWLVCQTLKQCVSLRVCT